MFFFLLLACSNSKTSQVQTEKDTQNPITTSQKIEQPKTLSNVRKDSTEISNPSPKQPIIEQDSKESSNRAINKPKRVDLIPSPNIDGMSKKEKPDKIYAEDIDEYINKSAPPSEPSIKDDEVVEVSIEANYNAHFNDSNSDILIQVYKDSSTIAASMSHDHVLRARGWEGQVIWKPNEPHNCIFEFQVPVHFLEVDPDSLRKKVNLPGVISKKDKKEIYKNMISQTQLWAEKHSHINFSAQTCVRTDKGVQINGDLTIRGISKKITTTVQISAEDKLSISGSFHLNQTSFGITPYSAFMGTVKNKNRIKISLDLNQ